jgi:hypothetical protein
MAYSWRLGGQEEEEVDVVRTYRDSGDVLIAMRKSCEAEAVLEAYPTPPALLIGSAHRCSRMV